MEYIDIADTGVRASRVGLGAWAIGGWMWGGTEEREAIATIHSAIDRGITLVDTAAVYGYGNSEEIVAAGSRVSGPLRATTCAAAIPSMRSRAFRNTSTRSRNSTRSRVRSTASA